MTNPYFIEVLLIEDRPEDAELTIRALKQHNLVNEVKWLEDGQEALDYLFRNGEGKDAMVELPKLILLDLKLPKVNGLEVLEKIKKSEQTKHIPIVVLTSSKEDVDVGKAYKLGANSYIVKPVDFKSFAESIKQVGLYWLLLNQPPGNK